MEAKSIDGILLTGLHNKLPIDEILRQAAQAAGIELCLYSAELEIIFTNTDQAALRSFNAVISHFYQNNFDPRSLHSIVSFDEKAYVVRSIFKGHNWAGILLVYFPQGQQTDAALLSVADRLAKVCGVLTIPDTTTSFYYGFRKLLAANLILNLNSDVRLAAKNPLIQKMSGNYIVCALREKNDNLSALKLAEHSIENHFQNELHVLKDKQILLFFHHLGTQTEKLPTWISEQIKGFCLQYGLLCGVSSCFDTLLDKNYFIQQALSCLNIADQRNILTYADNIHCTLFFEEITEAWGTDTFSLYKLRQIYAYDQDNGTEYFATLRACLFAHNRVIQAASSLYINHSTLLYRRKRMKELFDIDFLNPIHANILRIGIMNFEHNITYLKS